MPWFFSIPEFLKKRACRYLLQHYLGQFLEEKISLDDLTVDLYNGTGSIHNIPLNVEAINSAVESVGVPVQVVSGFIECVTVSVPWAALLKESCVVELKGLTVCVAPRRILKLEEYMSMTDSLFFSMTTSRQMAEEVIRGGTGQGEEQGTGFEGMEALAQAIELVLARVQISLKDTVFQINHEVPDTSPATTQHFLQLKIGQVEYYDEMSKIESSVDSDSAMPAPTNFSVKMLHLSGVSLELGSTVAQDEEEDSFRRESGGVRVADVAGRITLKVTLKQSEEGNAPKLEAECSLGLLHVLLSPHQLGVLQDMLEGIATKAGSEFEDLPMGQSRPIPQGDRRTLETQLARHQQLQQQHMHTNLLDADLWDATPLKPHPLAQENAMAGHQEEQFYSLDLNSSLGDSQTMDSSSLEKEVGLMAAARPQGAGLKGTVHRRSLEMEDVALHDGVGLQQLSQSPPSHRVPFAAPTGRPLPKPSSSCKYSLTLSGVTMALLEANPGHTYTASSEMSSGSSHTPTSSVDEGGLDANRYFELVSEFLKDGISLYQLDCHRKELAEILPADHLMVWLSVVRGGVYVVDDVTCEGDVTVGCGEIWEYRYHNHTRINHITNPVSVTPVVQLLGNQVSTPPRPGLKFKLTIPSDGGRKANSDLLETDMEGFMSGLHVHVDLTLLDRVQLLLSRQPSTHDAGKVWSLHGAGLDGLGRAKHSLYMTASNINTIQQQRQAVFNQAMAPPTTARSNRRLNIRLCGDTIHGSLRFPVPACSQVQPHPPAPWITSSLRNEILFLELAEWTLTSHLRPQAIEGEAPFSIHYQFQNAEVSLSLDGSVEEREVFLAVSGQVSQPSPSNFPSNLPSSLPTLVLEVRPDCGSSLEQREAEGQSSQTHLLDLLEESAVHTTTKPQPFSQQRSMFSARSVDSKDEEGRGSEEQVHSEEFVFPGTVPEMKEFADYASSASLYHLNCCFPGVRVHLPSKHFVETLYNRLGSDLVLWEPATPTAVSKANAKSMMYSCMDVLQPAATLEDRFLLCKSVLKEEDSDAEDDASGDGFSVGRDVDGDQGRGLSFFSVSLEVESGLISMFLEGVAGSTPSASSAGSNCQDLFQSAQQEILVEVAPLQNTGGQNPGGAPTADPQRRGVALVELAEVHAFLVSGFEGADNRDCVCAWAQDVALYHHGNLDCSTSKYSCVNKTFDLIACVELVPVFGPSSLGHQPCPLSPQPMLSVAMETSLDREHSTKTSKVAVCVCDGGMLYRVCPANVGPMQQLATFLNLQEETVTGYEQPALVTELHAHLLNCSLEYRPLYLPVTGTVVLDSASVSTSLVTGAPVHVVRVVLDGLHLLLTPTPPDPSPPEGRRKQLHSVCVLDMEWLELTLKHCNNALLSKDFQQLFSQMPDVNLECSSNLLHFRLCRDSCVALCDLLLYLSSQRDLYPPPVERTRGSRPEESYVPAEEEMTRPQEREEKKEEEEEETSIGDLISAAMEDASPTTPRGSMAKSSPTHFPLQKGRVQESGRDLLMEFDSDSEGEDQPSPSLPRTDASPRATHRPKRVVDSLFSDSEEDDFCIVATPTSTKVAPGAQPKVKCLLKEAEDLIVVEDHFSLPDGQMDQLRRPSSYPYPLTQYTLKEMGVVWHLYGGLDFAPVEKGGGKSGRGDPNRNHGNRRTALWCWPTRKDTVLCGSGWKSGGGVARDHSVLVELELDKIRVQHETYPSSCEQSSRLVVLVGDMEMRDRLADSHINKLLYQYTTEAMPKQAHASMVTLKVLFTQPEVHSQQKLEEASVYLSVLPIRLNMDQDTVLFLYEFARHVSSFSQMPPSELEPVRNTSRDSQSQPHPPVSQPHPPANDPTHVEVFIKSFLFQPELPIRIDYEAKGFKTEMGTVAGILFGLSHLNNSELTLKALHYKKGLLGWSEVVEYCTKEWATDIRNYQLPLLLKGVGPMHNVTQLVYGVLDFVRLPYQQYQEDGRLVWGLQRGTSALTSSTGVAVVELTSQLLETIQGLAQMAYDMVSPSECPSQPHPQQPKPYQPLDFREGFSNAYDVVYAGIGGTATDLYDVASKEHMERGVAGAVGGVLRHLPGTFVKPIILVSEATRHVLGGVKNQFVPDARREAYEKWRSGEQVGEKK